MPPRARSSVLLLAFFGSACFGDPDDPPELAAAEQEVINDRNATVATGHQHSCAVAADATVQCWGRNNYGQLGNGTTTDSALPVTVAGITTAVAVTAGKYHSCAALADGTARCWGQGDSGQLGNGSTLNRTTPVIVAGVGGVTSLSAGGAHTCATQATGGARCWGSNAYGQLGTNNTTSASFPQTVLYRATPTSAIVALAGAAEIETGNWSTCARMSSGAVACWGRNHAGQLGDGSTTQRNLPVAVSGISTATDVAVGDQHACAPISNGRVRCWGSNLMGQLGDGTQTQRNTPVEMRYQALPTLTLPIVSVFSAAAGQYHTCVRSAGNVWCAGRNNAGQLGMAITPYLELLARRTDPVVAASELAAGGEHTCVRRSVGGSVLCFGDDGYGQVGPFGRCPPVPTLDVIDVAAPGGNLYERGGVHYLDGDRLVLTIATTGCAQVSRVDFRNLTIDEDDPIETQDGDVTYEVTTTDNADGSRQLIVTIDFDNLHDGISYPVTVELTSPAGNTGAASITVAEVLEADPDHSGKLDISKEELQNEVLQAMWGKFGDGNFWRRGDGSFPDAFNLYDFDYANFQFFADSAGIGFVASVKVDLNPTGNGGPCDPTATVSGRFRIVLDGNNVATVWDVGPTSDVDWPNGCLGGDLNPILVAVGELAGAIKDDKVAEKIDDRIAEMTETCEAILGSCSNLVQSISHQPSAIRITLNPLFPAVTFHAPYRSSQFAPLPPGTQVQRGLAVPNDPLLLIGGGIVEGCGEEGCPTVNHHVGSSGLFNWNWAPRTMLPAEGEPWGPHPAILDPWQCDPVYGCAHIIGRIGPWWRQQGMRRDLSELPMPAFNVGGLVARLFRPDGTVSPLYFAGEYACETPEQAPTGAQLNRLVIGRNDHTASGTAPLDGELGRGDALVTVVFLNNPLGRPCPENPPLPPQQGQDPGLSEY